jgi:hypothetical protein
MADASHMIRMRFVAMIGALALLLGGWATYNAWFRPTPELVGATDAPHVAAVKALVAALPAPAGATLDPYGTWCDGAGAVCWTSTSLGPKALASALTKILVAKGGKVRSDQCTDDVAPGGTRVDVCGAVLDYHGSRIDVTASSRNKADNGGRSYLRLASPLATPSGNSNSSAALGPWASVDPLPPAWTVGVTCTRAAADGCRGYYRSAAGSPVIASTLAGVCDGVRAAMRGRFFFGIDEDKPATASAHAYCEIVASLHRSVGGRDGELVIVRATSVDPLSTTLTFSVSPV